MINSIKNFDYGRFKIITDRAATYAGRVITVINLLLLVNLNLTTGTDLFQYIPLAIIGGVLFFIAMIFDMVVIYPQEVTYRDNRSKVMSGIDKRLKEMEGKLNGNNNSGKS